MDYGLPNDMIIEYRLWKAFRKVLEIAYSHLWSFKTTLQ